MTRAERWALHGAALAVSFTGIAYGAAKYFGQRSGEFGPEPHPWLGLLQHGHVLAGPFLVFVFGMMVKGHVLPGLGRRASGRRSGLLVASLLGALILSGYLVQIQAEARLRAGFAWVHGPLGLLFLLAYAGHRLRSRGRDRNRGSQTHPVPPPGVRAESREG